MRLVHDYLARTCHGHGHPSKEMRPRWLCAPCLLEMLPRLRAAARAVCFGCSQDWPRPPDEKAHYHYGVRHPCNADDYFVLIAEIEDRLKAEI